MSTTDPAPAAHALPVLEVCYGARSWSFRPGQRALIGRGTDCQIFVDRAGVSRQHAELVFDRHWMVRDLGSANGTYLGAARIEAHAVDEPATVLLGGGPGAGTAVYLAPTGTVPAQRQDARCWAQPPPGAVLRIGRGEDNHVVVTDLLVSRYHAELRGTGGGVLVTDLGSRNGTHVNGEPLHGPTLLLDGDLLAVGQRGFFLDDGLLVETRDDAPASLVAQGLRSVLPSGTVLLDDVSFSLGGDELLAVVGPSGAGKSTLLGALTGQRPATSGQVIVDGRDLYAHYADLRSRIGLVPQDDVVHRQLTVRQALGYAAELRFADDVTAAERLSRVDEVLAELGLHAHADTRIDKISGGQRKRTSVALELLTKPSLLFLDEPTSGLDPGLDKQVMQTLRKLADDGRGVVVITHNVANLGLCDRVLVLAPGGGVAYFGPPGELLGFFGVDDAADIFTGIADDPAGSSARFASSALRRRQVSARHPRPLARADSAAGAPAADLQESARQLGVLVRRQLRVIAADRSYAAFLLVMPIVLGVLALAVPGDDGLTPPEQVSSEAPQLLVILVVGAVFMGTAASIRELVNERSIFRREAAAGLDPWAYLLAKLVVLTGIAVAQCALLVGLVLTRKPGPADAVLLGSGAVELFVATAVAASAAVALGLLLSSVISTAEQGMPLLVVSVMAQLVLCGGLFPVAGRVVLEQVSWLAPARWGYAAAASSTDITAFPVAVADTGPTDALWQHDAWVWLGCLLVLLGYAMVCSVLAQSRISRTAYRGTR